jgi:hypothetical protein
MALRRHAAEKLHSTVNSIWRALGRECVSGTRNA